MKFIERFSRKPVQSQSIEASPAPLLMALEPRIMFDASVGVVAQDAAAQTTVDAAKDSTSSNEASPAQAAASGSSRQAAQRHEVVFVDGQVSDADTLVAGLPANTEIVVLDPNKDGLQQMADYLKGREGLDAIHLLSHGADGTVQMGNVWLASNNLGEHRATLESIGAALKADGDLMLYGCKVGQGDKGQTFLDQLASITGADVAASVDDTGAAALGGNWSLERSSGSIQTSALNLTAYDNLMAVVYSGGQVATAPILGSTAANLMRMVVGDFNNDGRDDILYQDNTNLWRFAAGQADGTFITVQADQPGSPFAGLSLGASASNGVNYHAADFDGDGDTDLLVAAVSAQQLTLYRNNNGVFSPVAIPGGPQFGNRTIVGDFNGDGAADLLYQTTSTTGAPWRVMMNTGNGTMTDLDITDTASPFRNINLPDFILYQYRIADVDGDGDVDLIHLVAGSSMSYFRNDNGTFVNGTLVGIASALPQTRYMVADFDGDGDADILFQLSATTNDWKFYRNEGTNGSGNPVYTLLEKEDADSPIKGLNMVNMSNQNYRFGDFDGDGDLDLFASSLNVAGSVYLQSGSSPKLLSSTPGDDTLNVAPAANIVLTFDRAVIQGSGTIQIVRLSDGQITTISASEVQVSGSGTIWTINPSSNLEPGTAYAVRISPKAFIATDGKAYEGIANNTTLNFTTSSVLAPVIGNLNGDSVTYVEDSAYVLLDASGNATVSDADSANFNGGKLTAQITSGRVNGEDVLFIRDQGAGANQIAISGASIMYNGLVIGTFTGGSNGNPLAITFTANANATTVAALVQNLAYRNANTVEPSTASRSVSISMDDGAGGSSAVSVVALTVQSVNDAPVVNVTATNPTYTENTSAVQLFNGATINTVESGQKVTQMTFTVTTMYNGAAEKLVIDGSDVMLTNGTSVVTTNNNTVVTVSVISGIASVTLNSTSGLDAATAQTILNTMAYRNDSESPNVSNRVVTLNSVSDNGGSANGGVPTAAIGIVSTVTVVGVNDAPVLAGGPYSLPSINEDTTSTGVRVSTLLTNYTLVDADTGALRGIAVYGKSGNGTWQYSTDNATWTDFGAVSSTSALLLASTTYLRYVPDGANGETASFNFRGWDQTSGTASINGVRGVSDTTSNGGTTAFSTAIAVANQVVTSVNDAPVLTGVSPALNGITETAINNGGSTVLSLLGGVTDIDNSALKGMAITGLTATYGKWQYSLDAGVTWGDVGIVSTSSALMLTAQNLVRFVPDSLHGETATITYKAWDQSSNAGLQGVKVNVTTSGGTSAYSTSTDTASVVVTAVNDAPTLTGSGGSLTWTEGNNTPSLPVVIDNAVTLSDADGPYIASATVRISNNYSNGNDYLALVSNPATMGNIIGTWDAANGTLTLTSAGNQASLAQFQAALRAVTFTNLSDSPTPQTRTVQFQVSDGSLDSAVASRDILITAVDDAPVISAPAITQVVEDVASVINQISISDPDSVNVYMTLNVTSGTLAATSGAGVVVGGNATTMNLSGTIAAVNAFIANNRVTYTTAANATADATLTVVVDTGSVGTDTRTITLAATPVNDAPVVTVPGSLSVTEDVSSSLTGISFSDVDAGSGSVTATFSVTSGTLSAVSGSGVTVGDSGTATLTLSGTLSDINAFIAASSVKFQTALDNTSSVLLTVTINDNGNTGGSAQTDTKTVTINVTAVNDAPVSNVPGTQSTPQDGVLAFNTANGNAISISDVDAGNSLMIVTLSSVNGTMSLSNLGGVTLLIGNGINNSVIRLQGTQADLNAVLQTLTFKPNSGYLGSAQLTIQSNDQGNTGSGGAKSDIHTLFIDVMPLNPRVTSVVAQGLDRTVKVGDEVLVNVVFDQLVNVDLTGGIPSLLLETGLLDRNAIYQSGSGSSTLVFKYTVQAGDVSADLDFQSTAALQLNGATLANATSDLAILTLPSVGGADSLGGRSTIVVDGVAPVVTSVTAPTEGTYIVGQNLDFTVNFSENMQVDTTGGIPRIAVTLDTGGTVYADYVSGSGGSALVFRLTAALGQMDSNGITLGSAIQLNGGTLRDAAGNDAQAALNSVGSTANVNVDGVAPTVVSVATPADGSYKAGDVLSFTVNASEALHVGAQAPRLVLDVGGVTRYATYVSGSGSAALVFQYRVLAGDNDSNGIAVNSLDLRGEQLTDLAGNNMNLTLNSVGSTTGVVVDSTAPSASGIVRVNATPTHNGSVSFTVTFSEGVSGVDASDFALALTGTAAGTISGVTRVDGSTWTVQVDNLRGVGSLGLNLNTSGTGIVDAAGNALSGGLTGAAYVIDRVAPSVTGVDVPASGTYVAGQHLDFTVNLDEAVLVDTGNGVPRLAVTLGDGSVAYADYLSGSGSTALVFRLTVGNGQSGGVSVGSALDLNGGTLRDAQGNDARGQLNNVDSAAGIVVDAKAPRPTGIVLDGPAAPGDTTLNFTLSFDEAVSGVDVSDFSLIATGNASGTVLSVVQIDAQTYRISVGNITGLGSLSLGLNAQGSGIGDQAGNALAVSLAGAAQNVGVPSVRNQDAGDPEFRSSVPSTRADQASPSIQPQVPVAPLDAGLSPLSPAPLFEARTLGSGFTPLGTIFLNNIVSTPSFIAQVFTSSGNDVGGTEGGVFGSSSFAAIFDRQGLQYVDPLNVFNGSQWRASDLEQGLRGVFGAPTLGQQLNQINQADQRDVRELAMALAQPTQIGARA